MSTRPCGATVTASLADGNSVTVTLLFKVLSLPEQHLQAPSIRLGYERLRVDCLGSSPTSQHPAGLLLDALTVTISSAARVDRGLRLPLALPLFQMVNHTTPKQVTKGVDVQLALAASPSITFGAKRETTGPKRDGPAVKMWNSLGSATATILLPMMEHSRSSVAVEDLYCDAVLGDPFVSLSRLSYRVSLRFHYGERYYHLCTSITMCKSAKLTSTLVTPVLHLTTSASTTTGITNGGETKESRVLDSEAASYIDVRLRCHDKATAVAAGGGRAAPATQRLNMGLTAVKRRLRKE